MRKISRKLGKVGTFAAAMSLSMTVGVIPATVHADETCQSPYMAKIT